ncbi:hypothetical protein [Blastomonas marina]|nr:hypothetical protein [Blastomonas marina]
MIDGDGNAAGRGISIPRPVCFTGTVFPANTIEKEPLTEAGAVWRPNRS